MEILKQLYVAFIHPNLEYATAVWDPHLSKDIQKLESVQRFACKVCTKRWNDAYGDMLHILNIPPLSERRKLLKMRHLYKIVHGFIDFPNAPQCTSLAQITSPDTHILSPFYNPRLEQTLLFLTCCSSLEYFAILCCVI